MHLATPTNAHFNRQVPIDKDTAKVQIAARSMHGAIYFKGLDDDAFLGCSSLVLNQSLLTASFNIRMRRPVTDGELMTTGTAGNVESRLHTG